VREHVDKVRNGSAESACVTQTEGYPGVNSCRHAKAEPGHGGVETTEVSVEFLPVAGDLKQHILQLRPLTRVGRINAKSNGGDLRPQDRESANHGGPKHPLNNDEGERIRIDVPRSARQKLLNVAQLILELRRHDRQSILRGFIAENHGKYLENSLFQGGLERL